MDILLFHFRGVGGLEDQFWINLYSSQIKLHRSNIKCHYKMSHQFFRGTENTNRHISDIIAAVSEWLGCLGGNSICSPNGLPRSADKATRPRADGGPFGEHIEFPHKRPHQRGLPFLPIRNIQSKCLIPNVPISNFAQH